MKPITLKAPKISAKERERLKAHREALQVAIAACEGHAGKVCELRKKEKQLEKDTRTHERGAAAFHGESEIKLLAAQKGLHRVHEAIALTESEAHDHKHSCLWPTFDSAQETVQRICQATYDELIETIGAAVAPFYDSLHNACWLVGRNTPATSDLVRKLLQHGASPDDSIERLSAVAKDVLRKVDALLDGSEIWSYVPAHSSTEAAA